MQLQLLWNLERLLRNGIALLSHEERFKSVPNTKLNMHEAGENFSFLHSFSLGFVKLLDQPSNSFLRLLWFWCSWCSPEIAFTEPWLLSSLSKVTSKRTCQHSLSVWHECQRTACRCWWGTQFLVTAGMSDCYMHFKSLQKICWLESKSQSLFCW